MATSVIPKDSPLQVYKFRNFSPASASTPTTAELLDAINEIKALIPAPGPVVLMFGNSALACRCTVFASITNPTRGKAVTLSYYSSIDNIRLKLDSSGSWSIDT